MTLSVSKMQIPATRNSLVGISRRMKDGASVKDITGELKDKFVNRAKGGVAAAAIGIGTGAASGVLLRDGFAAKMLAKLPGGIQEQVKDVAKSDFVKKFANGAADLLTKAGTYAKAHPAIFAAVTAIGAIGLGAATLLQHHQSKTEGKIEQKYDDVVKLKNTVSTDILA